MSSTEILHSYRHLYRNLIRGVNDARRARKVAVNQLRLAYRDPKGVYDKKATNRTIGFLKLAAKENGIEHRILKNLIEVRGRREEAAKDWKQVLNKEQGKRG